MNNYIRKFEALGTVDINSILKEFNIKISDLDNIIEKISKYSLDHDLYKDLSKSKSVNYRDLRKWKVENYLKRYKELEPVLSKMELIEDILIGISDLDCSISIEPERVVSPSGNYKSGDSGNISIEFSFWPDKAIKKINDITTEILQISNHLETKIFNIDVANNVGTMELTYKLKNI
jgi:hypothetical protein